MKFDELSHAFEAHQPLQPDWITPAMSTTLAVLAYRKSGPLVRLPAAVASYAKVIGLTDALDGMAPSAVYRRGKSYSPLTRLDNQEAIERCSGLINDAVYASLPAHHELASAVAKVVGELHDNVQSHSDGVGFSAAQVVKDTLHFAIADTGVGMLTNVRRFTPSVRTHGEAIRWCMVSGHTTAAIEDPMAQWLPDDARHNPFPATMRTRKSSNNHQGLGLGLLAQLVSLRGGQMDVWSGDSIYRVTGSQAAAILPTEHQWHGVAIALSLPIVGTSTSPDALDGELEALGRRLGL